MKPIVGLDLSLRATGVCRMGERTTKEGAGVYTLLYEPKAKVGTARMIEIMEAIMYEVVDAGLVIIEGFSFASNGAMAREIAGLGWHARISLDRAEIPYFDIPPSQLKKFCTGKGNADKNVVIKEVFKRWGFDTNDDNLADAYALAQLGRHLLGIEKATAEFQREVLADVQKKNAALLMRVVQAKRLSHRGTEGTEKPEVST